MEEKDCKDWAAMRQCLWPLSVERHLEEIRVLLKNNQYIAFIVENESDQKVGFLEASIRRYANGCTQQPVLFLEGIWITESERRNKVGLMLIEELEHWALDNDFSELCSDCDIDNNVSIMSHKAWGFKETERVIYFRKNLGK